MNLWRQLGKVPGRTERIGFRRCPHFDGIRFQNPYGGRLPFSKKAVLRWGLSLLFRRVPVSTLHLPVVKTNLRKLCSFDGVVVIWLGHSSLFLQSLRKRLMVDPVLRPSASPFPGGVPAFPGTTLYEPAEIPDLDVLVITHDHYDHLDADTVCALAPRVGRFVVPLGVGAHLRYWGIPHEKIVELAWGETADLDGLKLTATPAVHMSGRSPLTRRTLWNSYVLSLEGKKLFLGGDGGYDKHFAEIGKTYGPFDLAFIENGQYSKKWPRNHLFPEQTRQVALDLQAKMLLPIHWGKFCLSDHAWNRPLQHLLEIADGFPITVPRIGEPYVVGSPPKTKPWWLEV